MDQQAKSTFTGIMAAAACIAAIGGIGYGIFYASQADERRKDRFQSSIRAAECSTQRIELLKQGKDFGINHPCRN